MPGPKVPSPNQGGMKESPAADAAPLSGGKELFRTSGWPLASAFPPHTDCPKRRRGSSWRTYLSSTDHEPGHDDGADARSTESGAPSAERGGDGQQRPARSSALNSQLTRRKPEARAGCWDLGSAARRPLLLGRPSRL